MDECTYFLTAYARIRMSVYTKTLDLRSVIHFSATFNVLNPGIHVIQLPRAMITYMPNELRNVKMN